MGTETQWAIIFPTTADARLELQMPEGAELKSPREGRTIINGRPAFMMRLPNLFDILGGGPDGECKYVVDQIYFDEEKQKFEVDKEWKQNLMPGNYVRDKYKKRLLSNIDAELEKETPDPIAAMKLIREFLHIPSLSFTQLFQIALDSLKYADIPKPIIAEKLQAWIDAAAPKDSTTAEFVCDVCGKVCVSASGLTLHKKTHEE